MSNVRKIAIAEIMEEEVAEIIGHELFEIIK
jgi:hypothetical protein